MTEYIRVRKEGGLFEVTLARPPLNILHGPMMAELASALETAESAAGAKVLLLRAEGKVFSAGADIDEHRPGKADAMIARFHEMFRILDRIPYPTVAFVHAAALGGGCELAIGCDVVLASEKAKFGQPEIQLGFLPPVAAALLPGKVGWARALELCCGGKTIRAEEALAWGLVCRVFPEGEAESGLNQYLGRFLGQSARILRLAKKALRGGGREGFLPRMEAAERIFLDELMATEDVREGLAAYDEKREPKWRDS